MKINNLAIFVFLSTFSQASFANPGLSPLSGTFRSSEGARFEVSVVGSEVRLQTKAELSRYRHCRAPITLVTKSSRSARGFAEAQFDVGKGQCAHIDGPITLHYNRAITGVDVYLIDVVLSQPRGKYKGRTIRWHLKKIR